MRPFFCPGTVYALGLAMPSCLAAVLPAAENGVDEPDLPAPPSAPAGSAAFDPETRFVILNSGYPMPLTGLGTYSLTGETCVNAVSAAPFFNGRVNLPDYPLL